MKMLHDLCIEEIFATEASLAAALDYAEAYTEHFESCRDLPASQREAEMLALQFPAILRPPQPGDLLAGRIRYGLVGVGPEPCGLGYYCLFEPLQKWLDSDGLASPQRGRVEALVQRWQGRTTTDAVRAAFSPQLASLLCNEAIAEDSAVGFPLYRMAGSVLDYQKLLSLGLDGLEAAVCGDGIFQKACSSAIQTLRGSIDYCARMESLPEQTRAALRAIRHAAPASFREALQLFWLYALHSGTFNYGRLDVALGPFLARDIDSGRLSQAEALELTCSLWLLIHDYRNQYNNRVIIGGKGRSDEAAADRFALLAIEATRRVRLNQPQLSLRFYEGQNPELWERALDAIGEGCTFPMLYNDEINIPAVAAAFGVPEQMAAQYTPYGCGEYVLSHYSEGTPSGLINTCKALEVALHGGLDPLSGRRILEGIPAPGEMNSFEDLWRAYAKVVEHHVAALAVHEKLEYDVVGRELPFLYLSLLTSDCVERGKGPFAGGARFLGGTLEAYGNTNAADSLHVIQELVFRQNQLSLPELVAALDCNFAGRESLRAACLAIRKYGNDEALADAMARRLHDHLCQFTRDQAARVGLDSYLVVVINNMTNTVLGWNTSASADGRLRGEPMANANNPSPGADVSGPTAFLNSIAKLDPAIHAGAVQNMKFGKEWFGQLRPKFDAMLHTYFAKGGTQAMITVVSRDDLESAMREPEKWSHLMVRVGGFSIRFIELPREAQMEVLNRTLH